MLIAFAVGEDPLIWRLQLNASLRSNVGGSGGVEVRRGSTVILDKAKSLEFDAGDFAVTDEGDGRALIEAVATGQQQTEITASATLSLYSSGATLNAVPTATWGDDGLSGVADPWVEDQDDVSDPATRQVAVATAIKSGGTWTQSTWHVLFATVGTLYYDTYDDAFANTNPSTSVTTDSEWQRIRNENGVLTAPIPLQAALDAARDWVHLGRLNLNVEAGVANNPVAEIDPRVEWAPYREILVQAYLLRWRGVGRLQQR